MKRKRSEPDQGAEEGGNGSHSWTEHKSWTAKGGKREGKWTAEEDCLLMETFEEYCQVHDWDDDKRLLPFVEGCSAAGAKGLWKVLALPFESRTLRSVQRRALKLFHPGNNKGAWTDDEECRLMTLVTLHGKSWIKVGRLLERFPQACKTAYQRLTRSGTASSAGGAVDAPGVYVGGWGDSEECALALAVATYGVKDTTAAIQPAFKDVSWAAVAARVGTRSAVQCASKWTNMQGAKHNGLLEKAQAAAAERGSKKPEQWSVAGASGKPEDGRAERWARAERDGKSNATDSRWSRTKDYALMQALEQVAEDEEAEREVDVPWESVARGLARLGNDAPGASAAHGGVSGNDCKARWLALRKGIPGAGPDVQFEAALYAARRALRPQRVSKAVTSVSAGASSSNASG